MSASILVTGGTGTIGSRTVPLLRDAGSDVRILTRHPRASEPGIAHVAGDTVKAVGLAAALDGVDTVLHLAGGAKGDDAAAENLIAAARHARVGHVVLISVVGADRMPIGYFRMKRAAEVAFEKSGLDWTVLRVAQLHDFALPVVRALDVLSLAPRGLRFESVGVADVAARLAGLALGPGAGRVPDLAGPEVLEVAEMVRTYRELRGRGSVLLPVRIPGAVGRAYREGANLAGEDAVRGDGTWREFLASRRDAETGTARR